MYNLENEIRSQSMTMPEAYRKVLSKKDFLNLIEFDKPIFIIGNGSSYNSALFLSMLFDYNGILTKPMQASLFNEIMSDSKYNNGTVIAFSQSGESADVINAVKNASKKGFKILSITNGEINSLSKISNANISYDAGTELAITATKTFTGSLMASLAIYSIISGNYVDINTISDSISRLIDESFKIDLNYKFKKAVFLGPGLFTVTALEGALKLRETAGIDAEGFNSREYEHGYIETLNDDTLVILIGDTNEKIKKYTSKIIEIDSGHSYIRTGLNHKLIKPIAGVIPLQVLAFKTALLLNIDPDHPGKLTKVVK